MATVTVVSRRGPFLGVCVCVGLGFPLINEYYYLALVREAQHKQYVVHVCCHIVVKIRIEYIYSALDSPQQCSVC